MGATYGALAREHDLAPPAPRHGLAPCAPRHARPLCPHAQAHAGRSMRHPTPTTNQSSIYLQLNPNPFHLGDARPQALAASPWQSSCPSEGATCRVPLFPLQCPRAPLTGHPLPQPCFDDPTPGRGRGGPTFAVLSTEPRPLSPQTDLTPFVGALRQTLASELSRCDPSWDSAAVFMRPFAQARAAPGFQTLFAS